MSTRADPGTSRWWTFAGWAAIVGSTMAWAAHLVFSGAWAVFGGRARAGPSSACVYGQTWPLHLATVATALVCLTTLAVAWAVYRHHGDATSGDGSVAGQLRFLGLVGIGASIVNLLLILAEGSYVFFLRSCG
jgi:hypothetical protein